MADEWPYKFNTETVERVDFPEYGGSRAMLYMSEDRRRAAGSFREKGVYTHVLEYDEFIYCIGGSGRVTIEGYETFDIGPGDFVFFKQGTEVTTEWHEGFTDIAVLVSDQAIEGL